jgi:hypothetical protein
MKAHLSWAGDGGGGVWHALLHGALPFAIVDGHWVQLQHVVVVLQHLVLVVLRFLLGSLLSSSGSKGQLELLEAMS